MAEAFGNHGCSHETGTSEGDASCSRDRQGRGAEVEQQAAVPPEPGNLPCPSLSEVAVFGEAPQAPEELLGAEGSSWSLVGADHVLGWRLRISGRVAVLKCRVGVQAVLAIVAMRLELL